MVSHFVKRALLMLSDGRDPAPRTREEWGRLARDLGVKGIHIAERDTQRANVPKQPGEFVNTWSIEGFVSEGLQPAELGWGTHEKSLPPDGARHDFGCGAAIYLRRPGAGTRVRSWTPRAGSIQGYLITHNESISIADYLTVREGGTVVYRPTCHYAYHPADDAILSLHELQGNAFRAQSRWRLMNDEIVDGIDELGVLLFGHARNAFWYGSQLSIEEARSLAPYQNATGLQVTSAVLAGMVWAIENPRRGVVESEELDHERILVADGALPRPARRPLHRLDAAQRPRAPVPGRPRPRRPVAVPERDRPLVLGSARLRLAARGGAKRGTRDAALIPWERRRLRRPARLRLAPPCWPRAEESPVG